MGAASVVTSVAELTQALASGQAEIEVRGQLTGMPMVTLGPGVSLRGGTLRFGAKGVRLTSDNLLESITVLTEDDEVAILNDTTIADLGTLTLRNVHTTGQVLLLAEDAVRAGRVQIEGLTVRSADVRGRVARPRGFGVEALQGAFTLWNRQPDADVVITAELLDIAVGSAGSPIAGSGVFVGGHGSWDGIGDGGTVEVSRLSTGEVWTDGGIPTGTPDLISGGVFVLSGASVAEVLNAGPVTTLGQNDMVLDNWGEVTTWRATAPVTSRGPSGIGFVNFGAIDRLDVEAPVETFGPGARGFNVYDGSLNHASFTSIATHGDGSIGVQVSKELPSLEIAGDLTTDGGQGMSLVKGVQVSLKAAALSVKPGGRIGRASIGGRMATAGDDVVTLEIEGDLDELSATGGISAHGHNSDAVHVTGTAPDLAGIDITSTSGQKVVRT